MKTAANILGEFYSKYGRCDSATILAMEEYANQYRWVDAKERLPISANGYIVMSKKSRRSFEAIWSAGYKKWYYTTGNEMDDDEVTYWQSFPKPLNIEKL
jgi:hypothetical protein